MALGISIAADSRGRRRLRRAASSGVSLVAVTGVVLPLTAEPAAAAPECQGTVNACYWLNTTLMFTHDRGVASANGFFRTTNGIDNDNTRRACAYARNDWTDLEVSTAPGVNNNFTDRAIQSVKWSADVNDCPG